MLKVFLVEDESFIREGLRDNIPWEKYGYTFVGEASDGEMALPMIRKLRPDVLITDIKMPFMDGLALSRIVQSELPQTRIIIISGYDDFEYARQAIEVGVEQYLLKPITKLALRKVLLELKEKIDQENTNDDYQLRYQAEMKEYEQFSRRHFFEKMLHGELSVQEIYEEAAKQSLDLTAGAYNLLFISLQDKTSALTREQQEKNHFRREEMLHFFLRYPQYILFTWNVSQYGILIKTDADRMDDFVKKAVRQIAGVCESEDSPFIWHIAVGSPVERLSMLKDCYQDVSHYLAYRYFLPDMHIFTGQTLADKIALNEDTDLKSVDSSQMDPEIIKDFLGSGNISEVRDFVDGYLGKISEALESRMFRDYVTLNIRFSVLAYADSLDHEEAHQKMEKYDISGTIRKEELYTYFRDMLQTALEIRDEQSSSQSGHVLKVALEYIDSHFCEETLSLNEVAAKAGVSPNYLSSVFSQSRQKTFIEYITNKRMEKAKKLLKTTAVSTGSIAVQVGYKDPRYFSFVFKKTQGLSPREYRAKKQNP